MTAPKPAALPAPPPDRSGWPWTSPAPVNGADRAWPRITIVTPSFNQAAYLEATIRSVLLQVYPNLEYIVIDGGSTDGSVEIIRKYAPWIDHWESAPDRGQSNALNKGLSRATGDWFNWINSDDYLLPGALFLLANAVSDSATRIVAGTTVNVRDDTVFGRYGVRAEPSPRTLFFLGVNQPGSLLRLEDIRANGGVREDLGLCMDLDLWQRVLAARGPACLRLVPDEVAAYRYHADSKTCREADPFALEEYALLFDLAISRGSELPASFSALRGAARFASKPPEFFAPSLSAAEAETAFLERLLIRDSLLFRALRKQNPDPTTLRARFLRLLDDARPALALRFPRHSPRRLRADALIAAAQSLPRFSLGFHWSAFLSRPSVGLLTETLRALLRS